MYNSAPAKGAVMHGPTKRADRKPSAAAPVTLPPERVGPVDWRRFIRADGKRNSNRPNSELDRMRNSAAKEPRSHGDCSVARRFAPSRPAATPTAAQVPAIARMYANDSNTPRRDIDWLPEPRLANK